MLARLVIKHGDKAVYLITAIIVIIFAIIMIVIFSNTGEKTPATCEQVSTELTNLDYEPVDSTDYYAKQSSNLKGSIAADNDNVRFNFFEFDNDNSALSLFENTQTQIYQNRKYGYRDWEAHYNNYAMYSMSSNGVYYITIWVGNTVVYAYCDEEYTSEIGKILTAIGYQE